MYFNDLLSIWLEKQKQARALSTYVKYRHLADRYISPYFIQESAGRRSDD